MNPICKVWAHKYTDADGSPYGVFECKRCGEVEDFNWDHEDASLNLAGKLWRRWRNVRGWILRKTRYFQKCHDCGLRFNRHTDDCPPF